MSLTVGMYSFDCDDAAALAAFWSGVLERPVDDGATAAYASIGLDGDGPTWLFVHSDDPGTGRNRVMFDLGGGQDWREQADRVEGLGARRVAEHEVEGVARWVEFRDPEDNTFRIFAPRPQTG
jgi:catechol 2,3-dioxygenase-like lactoylglutathione lyase family enzyme